MDVRSHETKQSLLITKAASLLERYSVSIWCSGMLLKVPQVSEVRQNRSHSYDNNLKNLLGCALKFFINFMKLSF
jgi:hypothetical protein